MRFAQLVRSAYVIGRRDFTATVMSKAFLLFLMGPLFPVLLGAAFGGIGATMQRDSARPVVAVVASRSDYAMLSVSRDRFARAAPGVRLVQLVESPPEADSEAQLQRLLKQDRPPVLGVLQGGLAKPHFTGAVRGDESILHQLEWMIEDARQLQRPHVPLVVSITDRSSGSTRTARVVTAYFGQALLFVLTILLAGMLLSQLIEEKSNKVIEILAAAVPVDAIFLGKLFAMLAMSLIGIAVWVAAGAGAIALWTNGGLAGLPEPAVGWPAFLVLMPVYFAMSYLLIGAVFLGIGAQASTVREVQTLSMPVTMAQVVLFAFASLGVGNPYGKQAIAAALFPLSSPFAMIGRAAEVPDLWPHLAAFLWQALWVALILRGAASLFRRSVLKSGPAFRWPWQRHSV